MTAKSDSSSEPIGCRRRSETSLTSLSRAFGDALRVADGQKAELIAMSSLDSGMSVEVLYESVISPAMWRIGRLWEQRAISVGDEHLATAITLRVMARIYAEKIRDQTSRPGRILLAAVEGQRHEIGLRMAGDILELNGYQVIYLGGDVPLASLLQSIDRFAPDLIAISSILEDNREKTELTIREISKRSPATPVMLGGPPTLEVSSDLASVSRIESLRDLADLAGSLLDEWGVARRRPTHEDPHPAVGPSQPRDTPEDNLLQVVTDATEEARSQARLARSYRLLAYRDPVTGDHNRRAFDDHLELLADTLVASPVSLMVLDLDSFKEVNDNLGHEAGDRLLRDVSRSISQSLREDDFAGRLGGDEFGILLPRTSLDEAESIASRILEALRTLREEPPVRATIGIALLGNDTRQTMIRADMALYEAKAAGRNRISVASEEPG